MVNRYYACTTESVISFLLSRKSLRQCVRSRGFKWRLPVDMNFIFNALKNVGLTLQTTAHLLDYLSLGDCLPIGLFRVLWGSRKNGFQKGFSQKRIPLSTFTDRRFAFFFECSKEIWWNAGSIICLFSCEYSQLFKKFIKMNKYPTIAKCYNFHIEAHYLQIFCRSLRLYLWVIILQFE